MSSGSNRSEKAVGDHLEECISKLVMVIFQLTPQEMVWLVT